MEELPDDVRADLRAEDTDRSTFYFRVRRGSLHLFNITQNCRRHTGRPKFVWKVVKARGRLAVVDEIQKFVGENFLKMSKTLKTSVFMVTFMNLRLLPPD